MRVFLVCLPLDLRTSIPKFDAISRCCKSEKSFVAPKTYGFHTNDPTAVVFTCTLRNNKLSTVPINSYASKCVLQIPARIIRLTCNSCTLHLSPCRVFQVFCWLMLFRVRAGSISSGLRVATKLVLPFLSHRFSRRSNDESMPPACASLLFIFASLNFI